MNTFLPDPDFEACADVLDPVRQRNQVNEADILIRGGWPNHPVHRLWNAASLMLYRDVVAIACGRTVEYMVLVADGIIWPAILHASHRSNLLRKSDHYKQFGWKEKPGDVYAWVDTGGWYLQRVGEKRRVYVDDPQDASEFLA